MVLSIFIRLQQARYGEIDSLMPYVEEAIDYYGLFIETNLENKDLIKI